jgi:hypothetical protein
MATMALFYCDQLSAALLRQRVRLLLLKQELILIAGVSVREKTEGHGEARVIGKSKRELEPPEVDDDVLPTRSSSHASSPTTARLKRRYDRSSSGLCTPIDILIARRIRSPRQSSSELERHLTINNRQPPTILRDDDDRAGSAHPRSIFNTPKATAPPTLTRYPQLNTNLPYPTSQQLSPSR